MLEISELKMLLEWVTVDWVTVDWVTVDWVTVVTRDC